MGKKWMRTIDSAQRQVAVTTQLATLPTNITSVIFQIQGVVVQELSREWGCTFVDMYDRGTTVKGARPLSVWDRILRREAPAGHLTFDANRVSMQLWTDPELVLEFDLSLTDQADLFRECEIMALSAGYHFLSEGVRTSAYKVDALDPID